MLVFFSVSCYLSWPCHFVLIFDFFNSFFYYPISIAVDVSKHFLKVFDFILQVLVVGAYFEVLVKHSDDVPWNVRTNINKVFEEIISHLSRFLKND